MQINKLYAVLATSDVSSTTAFYRQHLDLVPAFQTYWFVYLMRPEDDRISLALIQKDHESMPSVARVPAAGVLISVEVADVDAAYARFQEAGTPVLVSVRDEAWGQRHFIASGPDGVLLDVITPIAPSAEYASAYSGNP